MTLQVLDSVLSTMDTARENILSGRILFDSGGQATPYEGVMAREQTAGRGQRGRYWYSVPGESLCVTYTVRDHLAAPERAGLIGLLTGVAVADAIHAALPSESRGAVQLKWPNDVILNGKKVGGILTEIVRAPDGDWAALVGVGLNVAVREFPAEIALSAASLLQTPLPPEEMEALANRIAFALHDWMERSRQEGFPALLAAWRAYDCTAGRLFRTEIKGVSVVGGAEGVDEYGALLLRLMDGQLIAVTSASTLN